MTKIILPHSGYNNLIVYKKSDIIYQGTVVFCRRFLPAYGDRAVDQMTQAARSGKQNIAEGSAAAATSLETQIKLTNVVGNLQSLVFFKGTARYDILCSCSANSRGCVE